MSQILIILERELDIKMKIESSVINMGSVYSFTREQTYRERLHIWIGDRGGSPQSAPRTPEDILNISKGFLKKAISQKISTKQITRNAGIAGKSREKLKISVLEILLSVITGKKIRVKVLDSEDFFKQDDTLEDLKKDIVAADAVSKNQSQGWGIEYDYYSSTKEKEMVLFRLEGMVKTSDGQQINISLKVHAKREFFSEESISLRAGDAVKKDPIVINFDGGMAELTITKFAFDIDSDGANDNVSFVKSGSGFLALDKNNDGAINNGSELFGPSTGNGFQELSEYDSDGNKWIDENDPIFGSLRIWIKDSEGEDSLFTLNEKGVGAIYLENVSTPYSLKNNSNELDGQIKNTSIYLNENGSASTVQQLDLTT